MGRTAFAAVIAMAGALVGACGLPRGGLDDRASAEGGNPTHDAGTGADDVAAPGPEASTDGMPVSTDGGAFDAGPAQDTGTGPADAQTDGLAHDAGVPDAGAPDAPEAGPPPVFAIVQTAQNADGPNRVVVSTSSLGAGNFLAVLVTHFGGSALVSGISDDSPGGSNTYVSVGASSSAGTCQTSEIWYARNTKPGATNVTIVSTGGETLDAWIVEVHGMAASGGVDAHAEGTGPASSKAVAPTVTPTGAPALIVSNAGSCGALGGVSSGSPFVDLGIQDGNEAAYLIATAAGTYGPVYDDSNDVWNASVAAFR